MLYHLLLGLHGEPYNVLRGLQLRGVPYHLLPNVRINNVCRHKHADHVREAADVPCRNVLIEIDGGVKHALRIRDAADIPGRNALIETVYEKNMEPMSVTLLTFQAEMS